MNNSEKINVANYNENNKNLKMNLLMTNLNCDKTNNIKNKFLEELAKIETPRVDGNKKLINFHQKQENLVIKKSDDNKTNNLIILKKRSKLNSTIIGTSSEIINNDNLSSAIQDQVEEIRHSAFSKNTFKTIDSQLENNIATRKTSINPVSSYFTHILCTNCEGLIRFDDIDIHTDKCLSVKEEVIVNEFSSNILLVTDFKLEKLKDHIQILMKIKTNKALDDSYLSSLLHYIIVSKSLSLIGSDTKNQLKAIINQISSVLLSFKGSLQILILYERSKLLVKLKYNFIKNEISKSKYDERNTYTKKPTINENKNLKIKTPDLDKNGSINELRESKIKERTTFKSESSGQKNQVNFKKISKPIITKNANLNTNELFTPGQSINKDDINTNEIVIDEVNNENKQFLLDKKQSLSIYENLNNNNIELHNINLIDNKIDKFEKDEIVNKLSAASINEESVEENDNDVQVSNLVFTRNVINDINSDFENPK